MADNASQRHGDNKFKCPCCGETVKTFNDVTNAWQKNGYNYYDSLCPKCGEITTVSVKIQDD